VSSVFKIANERVEHSIRRF